MQNVKVVCIDVFFRFENLGIAPPKGVLLFVHVDIFLRFENLGIAPPKGVLLFGPPGTGKTLLARACAAQTKSTFLKLAGPQLVQVGIHLKITQLVKGLDIVSFLTVHMSYLPKNLSHVKFDSLFTQMFIGDGAKLVRDAFALAKEKTPAIIFIDELDAIGNYFRYLIELYIVYIRVIPLVLRTASCRYS